MKCSGPSKIFAAHSGRKKNPAAYRRPPIEMVRVVAPPPRSPLERQPTRKSRRPPHQTTTAAHLSNRATQRLRTKFDDIAKCADNTGKPLPRAQTNNRRNRRNQRNQNPRSAPMILTIRHVLSFADTPWQGALPQLLAAARFGAVLARRMSRTCELSSDKKSCSPALACHKKNPWLHPTKISTGIPILSRGRSSDEARESAAWAAATASTAAWAISAGEAPPRARTRAHLDRGGGCGGSECAVEMMMTRKMMNSREVYNAWYTSTRIAASSWRCCRHSVRKPTKR